MATAKPTAAQLLAALKPQQRTFVEAFCASFNATQAAKQAGYSEKTARQQGSQLLTKLNIKAAIKAVMESAGMEPEEIVARWARLARAGMQDFYSKIQIEVPTQVQQPLADAIAQHQAAIEFEAEYCGRAATVLGLTGDEYSDHVAASLKKRRRMQLQIVEWEMRLERDAAATRTIDGPPRKEWQVVLDLVKAEELGVLDLVKMHKDNKDGSLSITLKDGEEAMLNLAKHQGMLTSHVDLTSKGEKLQGIQLVDFDGSPVSDVQ